MSDEKENGKVTSEKVEIPEEVQEAWNTVARFLNKQKELTFHIDSFSERNLKRKYTLRDTKRNLKIVANTEWEHEDKPSK